MIIINKKRIQIIVSCILIAVFAFTFQIATSEKKRTQEENTVQTAATPVSGKTIVIDARSSEYQTKEHRVVQEQQRQKPI